MIYIEKVGLCNLIAIFLTSFTGKCVFNRKNVSSIIRSIDEIIIKYDKRVTKRSVNKLCFKWWMKRGCIKIPVEGGYNWLGIYVSTGLYTGLRIRIRSLK